MSIYKKRVSKNGRESFFKDGKHISRVLVPAEVLEAEPNVEVEHPKLAQPSTITSDNVVEDKDGPTSFISGEPATRRKWLNGQVYWLTEEEYNKYNLGKLAQAIREKAEAEMVAEETK